MAFPALIRAGACVAVLVGPGDSLVAQVSFDSHSTEPAVIPGDGTTGAFYFIRFEGLPSEVTLKLATGESLASCQGTTISLAYLGTDFGGGHLFSTVLSPSDLLGTYLAEDLNRNFVGCLRVTDASGASQTLGVTVNIEDGAIPDVAVSSPALDMRCAPHVVNILWSQADPWGIVTPDETEMQLDERLILQRFYEVFGDDYDLVNVVYMLPSRVMNRSHYVVSSDVAGLGLLTPRDDTALFGSAGALLGVSRFPFGTGFDGAHYSFLHELGHQWMNGLTHPLLLNTGMHWTPSEPARHIMGASDGLGQGGDFPYEILPLGGSLYEVNQVANSTLPRTYHPLELYLMGLLPRTDVAPFWVGDPAGQSFVDGASVTTTTLTIDEAAPVPRVPDSVSAPHDFRMATVVVTRMDLLTDREMAYFDHFAARGEATTPLSWGMGLSKSTGEGLTHPFAVATGSLGTLDMSVTCPAKVVPPVKGPPEEVECPRFGSPYCPDGVPPLLEGLDKAIVLAQIARADTRTRLRTSVAEAAEAIMGGHPGLAGQHLLGLLEQLHDGAGATIASRVAASLDRLTRQTAARLGILLDPGPPR